MTRSLTFGTGISKMALGSLVLLLTPSLAFAHHAMGGATPATFTQGLLSGIAHPVIGFDHLAFVVAAGIATALTAHRMLLAAVFVLATVAGCVAKIAFGVALPAAEIVIAASVLLMGGLVMSGRPAGAPIYGALFAIGGLFHGSAYADSITGAESTPLATYMIGFALIQYAIMAAAAWTTSLLTQSTHRLATEPRLAGAMVAGVGATFLLEHIEKIIFPGV